MVWGEDMAINCFKLWTDNPHDGETKQGKTVKQYFHQSRLTPKQHYMGKIMNGKL